MVGSKKQQKVEEDREVTIDNLKKEVAQLESEYDLAWKYLLKRSLVGMMSEVRCLKESMVQLARTLKRKKKRLSNLLPKAAP